MANKHEKKRRQQVWDRVSDDGRAILVGTAILLPGRPAATPARAGAGTCLLSIKLFTELLKKAVPERRPDGEDKKSFPSEHVAECVAAAAIIRREYSGKVGAAAAMLAGSVALARIESGKHHPRDVIAGALIGCAAVWLSLRVRLKVERLVHAFG